MALYKSIFCIRAVPIKIINSERYVSKPVFLPKLPQNCCPFGAPLNRNVDTKEKMKSQQKIQKILWALEINFEAEDKNKPKIVKADVAKITNLTKLIGSKLWEGETANETAGPTKIIAQ